MSDIKCEIEIESLNLEQLDVEELEHRLEMAIAAPVEASPCGTKTTGGCYINT
jgi:hypothetical protein